MKSAFFLLAGCLCMAGCGGADNTPPPQFSGGNNYAIVSTNTMTDGAPRTSTEMLFYYPDGPKGSRSLIWPMLTSEDTAVFDHLVVFNGGASAELIWKLYPALFAYTGTGSVVEITQTACRQIPGWQPGWTNFAFAIVGVTNNQVRLDASQKQPLDLKQPTRVAVLLDKSDILKAVNTAQTDTNFLTLDTVKFHVAP